MSCYAKRLVLILPLVLCSALSYAEDSDPQWYKGNLHTHSLWSDGNDYPEMICDWYLRHGYHFLALSDHNILSRGEKWVAEGQAAQRGAIDALKRYRARFGDTWVETRQRNGRQEVRLKTLSEFRSRLESSGRFLLIQGEEVTDEFESLPIHINASNLVELIRPRRGTSVRDTMSQNLIAIRQQSVRVGQPILAHVNHPNFGFAITAEDMAAVVEEQFFEVYNGHPAVGHLGDGQHVGIERMWDVANTIRVAEMQQPPLLGLATDDSHNYFGNRGSSPGRGWVMVRANQLAADEIIEAIQRGDFYASSGVTLDDVFHDQAEGELRLRIHREPGVEYVTEFVGTMRDYDSSSRPVLDDAGREMRVTRSYSADVGKVFQRVTGSEQPSYQITGRELYVRAVVTSSKPHPNPSFTNQREQAWTQPVTIKE